MKLPIVFLMPKLRLFNFQEKLKKKSMRRLRKLSTNNKINKLKWKSKTTQLNNLLKSRNKKFRFNPSLLSVIAQLFPVKTSMLLSSQLLQLRMKSLKL